MSKYDPLTRYLKSSDEEIIRLTFEDIEDILGCPLSVSAKTYRAMWANSSSHLSKFWTNINWKVNHVNYEGEKYVEFIRSMPSKKNDALKINIPIVKALEVPPLLKNLHELYELGIIDRNIYDSKKKVLLDKIR
ncbi:MAG: hypothetical protein KAQ68_04080 [Clostridiales bacterium]|nr:hypothetical protein [Clostridiales bacterium]